MALQPCAPDGGAFREKFAVVKERFSELLAELRIPTLDCVLYRRYLLTHPSPAALESLVQLTRTLFEHKRRTLSVLAAARDRDAVLARIWRAVALFAKGGASTVETQATCLRLLYALQRRTLTAVEAVARWRRLLTRPYAFVHRGQNYLLKILRDCKALEDSRLGEVLPLRLTQYALCSDLPSLALFRAQDAAAGDGVVTYPLKRPAARNPPPASPRWHARLRRAEVRLGAEFETQLGLTRELIGLCVAGYFVPILDTPVVPQCREGVRLNSPVWEGRLAAMLRRSHEELTRPPPLPIGWTELIDHDAGFDGESAEPLSDEFRAGEGGSDAESSSYSGASYSPAASPRSGDGGAAALSPDQPRATPDTGGTDATPAGGGGGGAPEC